MPYVAYEDMPRDMSAEWRRLKERDDTISVVMVEIMGHCDAKASDDHPVKVSFKTLLRWYDQLEACLSRTSGQR